MKIAYYLDLQSPQYLWLLQKSILKAREVMPDSEIILCTTKEFPVLDMKIDRYERIESDPGYMPGFKKAVAFSRIEGDCLFLDVDAFPRVDVRHVFNEKFDICLALRFRTKLIEKLPFNSGVAFTRSPAFWTEVAGSHYDHKDYFDIERRFCATALNDKYVLRVINGQIYNYSPDSENENLDERSIVHYKGSRKNWAEAA